MNKHIERYAGCVLLVSQSLSVSIAGLLTIVKRFVEVLLLCNQCKQIERFTAIGPDPASSLMT